MIIIFHSFLCWGTKQPDKYRGELISSSWTTSLILNGIGTEGAEGFGTSLAPEFCLIIDSIEQLRWYYFFLLKMRPFFPIELGDQHQENRAPACAPCLHWSEDGATDQWSRQPPTVSACWHVQGFQTKLVLCRSSLRLSRHFIFLFTERAIDVAL